MPPFLHPEKRNRTSADVPFTPIFSFPESLLIPLPQMPDNK